MAEITVEGTLSDVTSRPVKDVTAVTAKAAAPTPVTGGLIATEPVSVAYAADTGRIRLTLTAGVKTWLYLEGDGWSDSVPIIAAAGMTQLWEAIVNGLNMPSSLSEYLGIKDAVSDALDQKIAELAKNHPFDKWVRTLKSGQDLNELLESGLYPVGTYNLASSLVNRPPDPAAVPTGFYVVTRVNDKQVLQQWFKVSPEGQEQVRMERRLNAGTWTEWQSTDEAWSKQLRVGDDLNALDTTGVYPVDRYVVAESLLNRPPGKNGAPTGFYTVVRITDGIVHQSWTKVSKPGQAQVRMERYQHNGIWTEWEHTNTSTDTDTPSTGAVVRRELLLQQSRLRRGGVIGTGEATPVALSFDHGFTNFTKIVLPILKRLGLPCSVAVNPDTFGEVTDETSWEQLQDICLNNGVELSHHSRSHADAPTVDEMERMILSTISDVKEHAPEVVADSYIMPGVSRTGYDGFAAGQNPSDWWDHPAGRMIMGNFPVVTAALLGQGVPMTGQPVATIDRLGFDIGSWVGEAKKRITALHGTGMGIQIFMHPVRIDKQGFITAAQLESMLEWLAAERDAGRIEVLTVSGFAWAETGSRKRMSLTTGGFTGTKTVEVSPLFDFLAGAQVVLSTVATGSTTRLSVSSDAGGLDASISVATVPGQVVRLPFSIPVSAKKITLSADGKDSTTVIV